MSQRKKVITLRKVKAEISLLKKAYESGDIEMTHCHEDNAMQMIVEMAAAEHPDTAEAARAYLAAFRVDFDRWYA
jgi:hypothetical protein